MTTSHEKPCDFGHYLQLYRQSKGLSLEEVSAVTKIPVNRLKQLEAQDLSNLPAPVFVKGYIQAYAAAVNADLQDALQRFDSCCASLIPDPPEVVDEKTKPSGYWYRSVLAVVFLAVLVSITLFIAGNRVKSLDSTSNKIEEIERNGEPFAIPDAMPQPAIAPLQKDNTETAVKPATLDKELPFVAPTPIDVSLPPDTSTPKPIVPLGISKVDSIPKAQPDTALEIGETTTIDVEPQSVWVLKIRAIEPTWLTVSSDDAPPIEMSLKKDEVVRFKASDFFQLLIGNAGGVFLILNDQPIGVPGKSGQVKNLRLP